MGKLTPHYRADLAHFTISIGATTMKPSALAITRPDSLRKPRVLFCALLLLTASSHPLSAQSTKLSTAPTGSPSVTNPSSTRQTNPQEFTASPSRFVAPEDMDSYVQALASRFAINNRDIDPFGQLQDPNAKPIVKAPIAATKRFTPTKVKPFDQIVKLIRVTTIMPGEKSFLVGTRTFRQGNRFPMKYRGKNINVEVAAVNSTEIEFLNLDSGEKASLKLSLLPVGMTPGNGAITAPGMVRDRPNSPLEIEPGNYSNETSQN